MFFAGLAVSCVIDDGEDSACALVSEETVGLLATFEVVDEESSSFEDCQALVSVFVVFVVITQIEPIQTSHKRTVNSRAKSSTSTWKIGEISTRIPK